MIRADMFEKTLAIIWAGGIGSRLHPLTAERAKPAVPFGGRYRIVDFALSNCLHSGLRRVLVLTQYKSHSLQKHLRDGWSIYNSELGEYITMVPAQMRSGERWYDGTADAVFQNLYLVQRSGADWIVVLMGDHIYRMDYAAMVRSHIEHHADVTVACLDTNSSAAQAYGVIELDASQRVVHAAPPGSAVKPPSAETAYVSMGVYVFNRSVLERALQQDHESGTNSHDFARDVLPRLVAENKIFGYRFGGETGRVAPDRYWRNVATLDAYYEANMDMLKPLPPLNLYQTDWPIRTHVRQSPPARTVSGQSGNEGITINSIIGGGTVVSGGSVQESILFNNVYVDDEAFVEKSLLFDGVRVGRGTKLYRCIIEKDVVIPDGTEIGVNAQNDRARFTVSDAGVVVVPKYYNFSR